MGGGKSSHSAAEEPLAAWGEPQSTSELLQRIQTSETFRRSDRLKELLAYLVHRSETRPDAAAREQDIGTEVYGRDPDYDTSHDTIVRVQVAQLRKKLERYYETEGAADGQILTIPRGRYQVHWAPRTPEPEPPPAVPESHETAVTGVQQSSGRQRLRRTLGAVAASALLVLIVLYEVRFEEARSGRSQAVASLWSQLLVPGRTTHVVLSDPGIVLLALATGERVRFPELGDRSFLRRLDSIRDGEFRRFVESATAAQLATLSDVEMVRRITALRLTDPSTLNVVVARDFRIRDLNNDNTILVGYGLSNPWVEIFRSSLNFILDQDLATRTVGITNTRPRNGESPRYLLGDSRIVNPAQGYATVAFVPNPAATGKTLIISAADVPGTESAIRFLMSEELWQPFYRKIAVHGRVPWFQVVLSYQRLSNSSGNVSPVAWRVAADSP